MSTSLYETNEAEFKKLLKQEFAEISVPMKVSNDHIWGTLISAFEGGINYWVRGAQFPKKDNHIDFCEKVLTAKDDSYCCFIVLDEPLTEKEIRLHEKQFNVKLNIAKDNTAVPTDGAIHKVMLNRSTILAGLKLLAEKRPERMQRILEEQADAEDADVFFQYCVFGDTIYG